MNKRASRAVTQEQKEERRDSILAVGEAHLQDARIEGFSMEVLARELGYARGTLYRYFGSREEVLYALYRRKHHAWIARLRTAIKPGVSDRVFVRQYYEKSNVDPLLLDLRARLESVLMTNLYDEKLSESRMQALDSIMKLAAHYASCLRLDIESAHQLLIAYTALMLGATQVGTRGAGYGERVSKDGSAFLEALNAQRIFESNALLILEGLRSRCEISK